MSPKVSSERKLNRSQKKVKGKLNKIFQYKEKMRANFSKYHSRKMMYEIYKNTRIKK